MVVFTDLDGDEYNLSFKAPDFQLQKNCMNDIISII